MNHYIAAIIVFGFMILSPVIIWIILDKLYGYHRYEKPSKPWPIYVKPEIEDIPVKSPVVRPIKVEIELKGMYTDAKTTD